MNALLHVLSRPNIYRSQSDVFELRMRTCMLHQSALHGKFFEVVFAPDSLFCDPSHDVDRAWTECDAIDVEQYLSRRRIRDVIIRVPHFHNWELFLEELLYNVPHRGKNGNRNNSALSCVPAKGENSKLLPELAAVLVPVVRLRPYGA